MFGIRLEGLSVLECASREDAWALFGVSCQQQQLVTLSPIYNSETSGRWSCNLICQITWISAFLDIWLMSRFLCYYSWKVFLIVKSSIVYEIIPCKQKICSFKLCQKIFWNGSLSWVFNCRKMFAIFFNEFLCVLKVCFN